MGDLIIVKGAKMQMPTAFGPIQLIVPPLHTLEATGEATIEDANICQKGDEKLVTINTAYKTTSHPTPGMVKLTIIEASTASYVFSKLPVITAQKWKVLCSVTTPATDPKGNSDATPPQSQDVSIISNPNQFVTVG